MPRIAPYDAAKEATVTTRRERTNVGPLWLESTADLRALSGLELDIPRDSEPTPPVKLAGIADEMLATRGVPNEYPGSDERATAP